MHDFKRLAVWNRGRALAAATYRVTATFPKAERFGLVAQMRRAAVSIPSNIAEGSRSDSEREFRHYLRIAYGSACELETQAMIANDLDLSPESDLDGIRSEANELSRMLFTLIRSSSSDI